jgi:orotate phosphoribosyltransferase-like protein
MARTGRPNRLNDPDFAKNLAELWIRGVTYKVMAEELDCHADSIRTWVKDPRVIAHARKLAQERTMRITRSIDGEMDRRLANISDWALDEILKVRKEYLDRPLKVVDGVETDVAMTTNEISEAMDDDPDFAEQLLALVDSAKSRKKE